MNPVDDELRHYAFARSSGLPLNYFKRHRRIDWPVVCGFVTLGLALALILAALA